MKYSLLILLLLSACGKQGALNSPFSYPCTSQGMTGVWISGTDSLTLSSSCAVHSSIHTDEIYWVNDGDYYAPGNPLYDATKISGALDLLRYEPKIDTDMSAYVESCAYVINSTVTPMTLTLTCPEYSTNTYVIKNYTK